MKGVWCHQLILSFRVCLLCLGIRTVERQHCFQSSGNPPSHPLNQLTQPECLPSLTMSKSSFSLTEKHELVSIKCLFDDYSTCFSPKQNRALYILYIKSARCSDICVKFMQQYRIRLCCHHIPAPIHNVNLCLVSIKYENPYWTHITVPQK